MDTVTAADEQVQRASDYIAALELPEDDPALAGFRDQPPLLVDSAAGGAVDAGSLVSFVAGLSTTHKGDVLNSCLLAQLAANKLWDREEYTKEWYAKYHEVLENVGWVISGFDFTKYNSSASEFEIEKIVLEILTAIASGPEIAAALAVIAALKEVNNGSKAFKLWDEQTNNGSKGNFQISTCLESDGNVAMSLAAFYFRATKIDFQFLWFKYGASSTEIYKAAQVVVLNEQVYSRVRDQVVAKLGDKAVDYVADLDI